MRFNLTDSQSGDTLTIEADKPPTQDDVAEIFRTHTSKTVFKGQQYNLKKPLAVVPESPQPTPEESYRRASPASELGSGLHKAGQITVGALADFGQEITGQNQREERRQREEGEANQEQSNLDAALAGEPLPTQAEVKQLPTGLRIAAQASQGLAGSVPQLAAVTAMQAIGIPAPVAAGVIFGSTPQGFDVKQGAVAAALPFVGKYSGEITALLAKRLGVTSEKALQIYNASGGAAGATAYLGTIQASEIVNLPPEQRKDAVIEAIAANIGQLPLAINSSFKSSDLHSKANEIAPLAPLTAEALKATAQPKESNASSIGEAKTFHGALQPQPIESAGKVPAAQSSGGIQPQASERLSEAVSAVSPEPLQENARPAAGEIARVAALSPEQFRTEFKKGFTETALNLGSELNESELADAIKLRDSLDVKAQEAKVKATASMEEADLQAMSDIGMQRQFVSEAIQGAKPSQTSPPKEQVTTEPDKLTPVSETAPAPSPEHKGPGSTAGETGEPGNPDIYGIAQRVREQRAVAGQVAEVPIGDGVSAADSVQHGRDLLKSGSDPEQAVAAFEKTKALSSDAMALARARGEQLAFDARRIEEKFGTNSPEYKAAWQALSDWDARTKPMQTEWHKMGQAQQGETDIDTGTFTGLQRAHKADTGKDFTSSQEGKARIISGKVKVAETKLVDARAALDSELIKLSKPTNDALRAAEEARKNQSDPSIKVWERVREYLEQGDMSFDDMRNKVATDLGMSVNKVTDILTRTERAKYLANDAWRKQQDLRRFQQKAKRWLNSIQTPAYQRAIAAIPRILFSLKVGFHGTVALGTHAPMVAFQPTFWKTYVTDFVKMYKMVGSPSYYERQVQDLLRRPNYITARRAGLVNDPSTYEDFNSPEVAQWAGRLSGMGNRGYAVLKILRQDMFDQHWNQLPKTARIPEVAKAIADGVNHATGVVKVSAPKGANVALFAPRLLASRVAWLAIDPAKAADTFLRWNKSSEADKIFAINQVKEKAWVAGTLFGLLALNQGFLAAINSKQKVNLTNPFKSDWLKFKAGGMTLSYGNAMLTMARLPVRLWKIRESDGGKLKNLIYPDEDTYSVLGEYVRSQMSPFASLVMTLWLKGDWQNRPLPSSDRPVPKRLRAQGVKPYTWAEFWAEQVAPIPAEEAMREVWRHGLGMQPDQISAMLKAMATIAVMSATGARLTEDVDAKK